MAPPWTAAEAASESVSKKQIITYLQENADDAFLSSNKLTGQPNSIVKRITKDVLVDAYTKFTGGSAPAAATKAPAAAAGGGFSFTPPAGGEQPTFSFGAPPQGAAASPPGGFAFNFTAPPPAGGKGGGKGKGGKPSKAEIEAMAGGMDDDDEDLEEIDTSNMRGARGGGKGGGVMGLPEELQKKMAQMNMTGEERREATMAELSPEVRKRVESLEKLQENVDGLQKEFDEKLVRVCCVAAAAAAAV